MVTSNSFFQPDWILKAGRGKSRQLFYSGYSNREKATCWLQPTSAEAVVRCGVVTNAFLKLSSCHFTKEGILPLERTLKGRKVRPGISHKKGSLLWLQCPPLKDFDANQLCIQIWVGDQTWCMPLHFAAKIVLTIEVTPIEIWFSPFNSCLCP